MTQLLDGLVGTLDEDVADHAVQLAAAEADFYGLVHDLTAGKKITDDRRDEVLQAAQKTPADLLDAVKVKQRRLELWARVCRLPTIAQERQSLAGQLRDIAEELEAAELRLHEAAAPLQLTMANLNTEEVAANSHKRRLIHECPYQVLHDKLAAKDRELFENAHRFPPLQQIIGTGYGAQHELDTLPRAEPRLRADERQKFIEDRQKKIEQCRQEIIAGAEAAEELEAVKQRQSQLEIERTAIVDEMALP